MGSLYMKIDLMKRQGIDVLSMSADQWLELAIETEQLRKSMSPFDWAFPMMVQKELTFLKAAALAEQYEAGD